MRTITLTAQSRRYHHGAFCLLSLLIATLGVVGRTHAESINGIELSIEPPQGAYQLGQTAAFVVFQCNTTPAVVEMVFSSGCDFFRFQFFDDQGAQVAEYGCSGSGAVLYRSWDPFECKTQAFNWNLTSGPFGPGIEDGQPLPVGDYTAVYTWTPNSLLPEAVAISTFSIRQQPPAVGVVSSVPASLLVTILIGASGYIVVALNRKRVQRSQGQRS